MSVRNCGELGINLQKIVSRMMANDELVNLLYYTDKDPLSQPKLTDKQKQTEVFDKLIRIVPTTMDSENDSHSIVAVYVTNGIVDSNNAEFREIALRVDVFVPLTQWKIKDSNLRPFAILGAIQDSCSGKTINGLGKLKCGDFSLSYLTSEISVYQQELYLTEYD